MAEAQEVGERLSISFKAFIGQRLEGAEAVGEHETCMPQDIEAGKPTEIDAMVGAVSESDD